MQKKRANVVAIHLTAWLHKLHGHKDLTSFSEEDQKESLETMWNCNVPLDTEEVETQTIVNIELQWL